MFISKKFFASLSVAVLLIAGLVIQPAVAQQTGGSGLDISPTRDELSIQPGATGTIKISLKNVANDDVVAKVDVNDFEADNQTGEPHIITDKKKQLTTSIKPFLLNVTDVPLKKGEKKDISIPVEIPQKAAPGAYYSIIRYTAVPVNQGTPQSGQVALNASVGTIVLLEIPGNLVQRIQIRSMTALHDNKGGSLFLKAPDKLAVSIANLGNGFSKPFGKVNITNMAGKQVYSYELNTKEPRGNILPGSARSFTDDIKGIKLPGRYTAVASISHASGGEVINYKASFWYLPLWTIVLLGLIVLAIIVLIFLVYRRRHGGRRRH